MDRSRPSPSSPRLPVWGSVQSDLPVGPDRTEPYPRPGPSGLVESLMWMEHRSYRCLPEVPNAHAHAHSPPIIVGLRKAHYSLKQEPQLWHDDINTFLLFLGFTQSQADPNRYIRSDGILILLYLDDTSKISRSTAHHGNSPP